jgi:hypothetical protein
LFFDFDENGKYSAGDALVLEQGGNNGLYDAAQDLIILDPLNKLSKPISLHEHHFCPLQNVGRFLRFAFHDQNNNDRWDSGEDIVIDVNGDGDFDP